jgi:Cysteine-rich CPXCG
MKRPIPNNQRPKPDVSLDDTQGIDAKYGLEPVLELSSSAEDSDVSSSMQFHLVQCPYCGENFETQIDISSGSARYVEDCQVCCQPIEFVLKVDLAGAFAALSTLRGD